MKGYPDKPINEARALYGRLVRHARQLARREQRARQRSPLIKSLRLTCALAATVAALTVVYGLIRFPDAPIRQSPTGYVSKNGRPRTQVDYEQFKLWKKLLVVSYGLTFLTGFSAMTAERIAKKRAR